MKESPASTHGGLASRTWYSKLKELENFAVVISKIRPAHVRAVKLIAWVKCYTWSKYANNEGTASATRCEELILLKEHVQVNFYELSRTLWVRKGHLQYKISKVGRNVWVILPHEINIIVGFQIDQRNCDMPPNLSSCVLLKSRCIAVTRI